MKLVSLPYCEKGEDAEEDGEMDSLDNVEFPELVGEIGCPSELDEEEEDRATGEEETTPPVVATSGKSLSPGKDCRKEDCFANELALDLLVNSCSCAGSCFWASR